MKLSLIVGLIERAFPSDELEVTLSELQEKLAQVQKLATTLQVQLAEAQCDASDVRREKDKCVAEHEAEKKRLQEALEVALAEKKRIDEKWHVDFELLRTVNSGLFKIAFFGATALRGGINLNLLAFRSRGTFTTRLRMET